MVALGMVVVGAAACLALASAEDLGAKYGMRLLGKRSGFWPLEQMRFGSLVYPLSNKRLSLGKRGIVSTIAGLNNSPQRLFEGPELPYYPDDGMSDSGMDFEDPILGNGQMKAFQSMLTGSYRTEKKDSGEQVKRWRSFGKRSLPSVAGEAKAKKNFQFVNGEGPLRLG